MRMVTEEEPEEIKIDVVEELHKIRKKFAKATSDEIERVAIEVRDEIKGRGDSF